MPHYLVISTFTQIVTQNALNTDDVVASATRIVKEIILPELKEQFDQKLEEKATEIKAEMRQEMEDRLAEKEEELKAEYLAKQDELRQEFLQSATENKRDSNHELEKLHAEKSCQELSYHGIEESGAYFIDSDGEKTGEKPFKAFCEFQGEEVSTKIAHDVSPNYELDQCTDGPGCSQVDFNYQSSVPQMKSLIEHSTSCYQDIQVQCVLAPLQLYGQQLGWFLDVNGQQRYLSSYICNSGDCNCDENSVDLKSDFGRIEDLELLT